MLLCEVWCSAEGTDRVRLIAISLGTAVENEIGLDTALAKLRFIVSSVSSASCSLSPPKSKPTVESTGETVLVGLGVLDSISGDLGGLVRRPASYQLCSTIGLIERKE